LSDVKQKKTQQKCCRDLAGENWFYPRKIEDTSEMNIKFKKTNNDDATKFCTNINRNRKDPGLYK